MLQELKTGLDSKLRDIAKTFFNRAMAWGSQMAAGFAGSQGGLFSKITSMVATINSLLRKIITSFHLSITYGQPTAGSGSMGGGARPSGGGGGGGGGSNTPRASGGPVIGGQRYSVSEFFRPERFVPATNGRIDPIRPQPVHATIDEARLARVIVQALMQAGFGG